MSYFDVTGESDENFDVVGEGDVLGAGRPPIRLFTPTRTAPSALRLPPQPAWRGQIAPGVPTPGEGLETLPMLPDTNDGVFDPTHNNITWTARPQKPFRGERLVAIVSRIGAAGIVPVINPGIFVGTLPQAAELGDLPLEVFAPTSFGVRMAMVQAPPGVLIRIPVKLNGGTIPANEKITVAMMLLGRSIR